MAAKKQTRRRAHYVQITLDARELAILDGIAKERGLTRAAVFRALLMAPSARQLGLFDGNAPA